MRNNLLEHLPFSYGGARAMRKAAMAFALICLGAQGAFAGSLRILAFGDSLTQGYGLMEADGFVPQLQRWLERREAEVTVVNGGVSGDTTAGGAARIAWSLSPDIGAVIVTLGGNDMLRGLAPSEAKANLAKIIEAVQGADLPLLLIGMQAPGNYGAAYKAQFEGLYAELAQDYGTLYEPQFLGALGQTPTEALVWMQEDGIHPNEEGVLKIVEALGPRVLELADMAAPER
ncbi:arylesterase [uncultured Lentibacter sp.]|uniref:arylesterase n=1 Tax=uncultured Lentibacter sp. TaxID=1659309 RepID=UPI0026170F50|nr:arylesterase [uncultured Lentibacter sp.]